MPIWPEHSVTQELLADVGRGKPDAVDRLLERHRASLRKLVQLRLDRRIARRVDASDIVQDVLLEANERLANISPIRACRFTCGCGILRRTASSTCIGGIGAQRRSTDREQSLAGGRFGDQSSFDLAGQLAAGELTPAAASIRKELEQRFLAALDQLDDDDRDILLMRHFEQLGNSEAAQMLGLSAAAAGMRHLRALRKLRTVLGERPSLMGEEAR